MFQAVAILAMFLAPILRPCSSYVLLTANVEDIDAIARRVFASGVGAQLKNLWQKAADAFQKEMEEDSPENTGFSGRLRTSDDNNEQDLVALGKEVSKYVNGIQKFMSN